MAKKKNFEHQLIVGSGTGRCGTHSLAALLSAQKNTHVTHERFGPTPWQATEAGSRRLTRKLQAGAIAKWDGDVSLCHMPHLEWYLNNTNARVIVMERDPEQVADSYIRSLKDRGKYEVDHWKAGGKRHAWDRAYPNFNPLKGKKQRILEFCQLVGDKAMRLKDKFPNRVLVVPISMFDNENMQHTILDHALIPKEDRVIFPFKVNQNS